MRRLHVVLTVVCLALVLGAPGARAQGPAGTTWLSSINIVNLDESEDANIVLEFYGTGASAVSSHGLDPLPPLQSVEVYLPSLPSEVLADGRYSVVILSDKPVYATAGTVGSLGGVSFYGAYSGAADGATSLFMPDAQRAFWNWNSFYTTQNAGDQAADITLEVYAQGNSAPVATDTHEDVPPGVSVDFDLSDSGYAGTLGTMFNGSAVISSLEPLVAVDHKTNTNGGTAAYEGFADGSDVVYVPELARDNWGWWSILKLQNIDATNPTTVTIEYGDGLTAGPINLGPLQSVMVDQRTEAGHGLGAFSAVVTSSDTEIVALGNKGYGPAALQAQTYQGVPGGTPTALCAKMMRDYWGWYTSYSVMNISDTDGTDVTVTLSPWGSYPGTSYVLELDPFEVANVYQGNDPNLGGSQLPNGYRGSLTLESSATNIVALCNEVHASGVEAGTGDWSSSASAINR